ncbi:ATP-dependent RecD-like DNA helicase [bacterium]|nr:ATP-dependent RecD-like DNA helicase [bacterium]
MNLELSEKQTSILNEILKWKKDLPTQSVTLGGYAGTGKTTLMGHLSNTLREKDKKLKIAFCSYTGKAARVLQRKLKDTKSIYGNDYIGTIHRLIYRPILDDDGAIVGWEKLSPKDFAYDMIVIDEASMVTQNIWNDLLSFSKPILAVGDHGQLPPIEGKFNLMEQPEFRLEEIYRQEANNPIIMVSQIARRYGVIPIQDFSSCVKKLDKREIDTGEFVQDLFESYDSDSMVLVGYNNSRVRLNQGIRQLLGFESPEPSMGDRVICLKNNHWEEIFNGMTGTLVDISEDGKKYFDVEIDLDEEDYPFLGKVVREQFNRAKTLFEVPEGVNLFDFGYALTVHKAQGSQAKRVVVFEERFRHMDDDMWRRWLYTAVTRASEELYIIGD